MYEEACEVPPDAQEEVWFISVGDLAINFSFWHGHVSLFKIKSTEVVTLYK